MLNLDTLMAVKVSNGTDYQVYQDHTDKNQFYVVPVPVIIASKDGTYQFGLYEYSGADAGGYCIFSTCLSIPGTDLTQIEMYLKKEFAHLQPDVVELNPFSDLTVTLTYASSDGTAAGQITAVPSAFQNNEAVFLVNLDQNGLSFFKSYFGDDTKGGICQIAYEFTLSGYLPAVSVVMAFNAAKALSYEKKVAEAAPSLAQYLKECWNCVSLLSGRYTSENADLADTDRVMGRLVGSIGRPVDEESFTIEGILALSGACLVDVSPATPEGNPEVLEGIHNWADQLLKNTIRQELEKTGASGGASIFGSIDSFSRTYQEKQAVNWIQKTASNLPGLPGFHQNYLHTVSKTKEFNLLVSADVDFTDTVKDIVVTITYPGLANSSATLEKSSPSHVFSADWDEGKGGEYSIQYTASFKNKTPDFTSPSVQQDDTSVSIALPELGIQSVFFDASAIQFGDGGTQIQSVDINVYFSGTGQESPVKTLTLDKTQAAGWVHSIYQVPVNNTYTYTVTYYQSKKTHAVYTTSRFSGNQSRQAIFDPLIFGNVTFVGEGFHSDSDPKVLMIELTVDDNKPVKLNTNKEDYSIPCVFSPQEKLVTYSANLITTNGPVQMNPVTRPVIGTIPVGVGVPWWFSVKIDPTLIPWKELSMIEVKIGKGTVSDAHTADTYAVVSDTGDQYWGFPYKNGEPPQYFWGATYYYKDGQSKTIASHDPQGYATVLTLPASAD